VRKKSKVKEREEGFSVLGVDDNSESVERDEG